MPWEIVYQRKRMPEDLQAYLSLPTGTLRVPEAIDTKIRTRHAPDVGFYESLNDWLPGWKHAIPDPVFAFTWQVYIPIDEMYWIAVLLAKDANDSYNLISVFRIRDRNVRNRVRKALED
ncbi:MAG: hypothetical protein KC438_10120 [Thermomicrobiales bacterium]|nr:hypothetical protein [Thermomicrobiales bacterium]MCO5221847.1 hypothetical protein [Thermomicrobiales bacterium]